MHSLSEGLEHMLDDELPVHNADIEKNLNNDPYEEKTVLMFNAHPWHGCIRRGIITKPMEEYNTIFPLIGVTRDSDKMYDVVQEYNHLQKLAKFYSKYIDKKFSEFLNKDFTCGKYIVKYFLGDMDNTEFTQSELSLTTLKNSKYDWMGLTGHNGGRVYCIVCAYSSENWGFPLHFVNESILDYHASSWPHVSHDCKWKGPLDFTQE